MIFRRDHKIGSESKTPFDYADKNSMIIFKCWRLISLVLSFVFFSACSPKELAFELSETDSISGSVDGFYSSADSKQTLSSSCTDNKVELYSLNSHGQKDRLLLESKITEDGRFQFQNLRQWGLDSSLTHSDATKYLLEFECGSPLYQRFVTGTTEQNLSEGVSFLSWLAQTPAADLIPHQSSLTWQEFYNQLATADTVTEAFSTLNANTTLKEKFQHLFNINLEDLTEASPKIRSVTVPARLREGVAQALSVQSTHWSPNYDQIYSWRIGSSILSTSNNFNFTPGANHQGHHTLQLFIGKNNGSDQVDTSKPYIQKSFDVTIDNDIPAQPPAMMRISNLYTNSAQVQLQLDTGLIVDARALNCHSFSKLAITEEQAPPLGIAPLLLSSYTIDCNQTPTQNLTFTLSGIEGHRVLRLWAIDKAGNRSNISSDVDVFYDITPPVLALNTPQEDEALGGGQNYTIIYTLMEHNPTTHPITLEYSANNGSSWSVVAENIANTGSFNWSIPSIDSDQVLLRIAAQDLAGNSNSVQSASAFIVDSTIPTTPNVARTSPALSKERATTFTVQDCADRAFIYAAESALNPDGTETGWQSCDTSQSYSYVVSTGDGAKSVRVWAKDRVGHISPTFANYTMTLDQTGPLVSLTSFNGGEKISGNPFQLPAINKHLLTWTASDLSGLKTDPISIEYSSDSGATWIPSVSDVAHTGTYLWTLPNINSSQFRVRVKACDILENCAHAASSPDVSVDSLPPTLNSVTLNDGAHYAGTTILGVKVNLSDNFSGAGILRIKLASAHPSTGNCQSEFSDAGWISWISAATAAPLPISPIDGTKKICVWGKDAAGNISQISANSGLGNAGVDFDTIQFEVGTPPKILSFQVENGTAGPNLGTTAYTAGDIVKIHWSIEDTQGLHDQPFSLAYTTDNSLWKDVVTNQNIADESYITWLGNFSGGPSSASGTYNWTAPSSGYFRLRIVARDNSENTSIPALSLSQNTGTWSIFAGSKDRGDGGTGTSAFLNGPKSSSSWFAIHPRTNDIYAVDGEWGLRKLDVKTGKVTTLIQHGSLNLPNEGTLPVSPKASFGDGIHIRFDHNGLFYIHPGGTNAVYQINWETNHVRKYVGGGTNNGSLGTPTDLYIGSRTVFTFDDIGSMYFFTDCNPTTSPPVLTEETYRIVKVTQKPMDKTADTVSVVAGDCSSRGEPSSYPVDPVHSPIGPMPYASLGFIAAWNGGQVIYFKAYGGKALKIINGQLYRSGVSLNNFANLSYDFSTGNLYGMNGSSLVRINPNLNGDLGDTMTPLIGTGTPVTGCAEDDVIATAACITTTMAPQFDTSGNFYFSDGTTSSALSAYRIRYWTADNKIRTIFGTKPFFGDGLDKNLIRGNFAGIHYKKATDPNQTAFPAGLYFMDYQGCVLGHIDESTSRTNVIWGDQSQISTPATGTALTKIHSMGESYVGGNCMPLAFDTDGLPWTRASNKLSHIDSNKAVSYFLTGTQNWEKASHNETGTNTTYRMYPHGGLPNLTLLARGIFLLGTWMELPTQNHPPRLHYFDTVSDKVTKVMGGLIKPSEGLISSPPNQPAGGVFDTNISGTCINGGCKIWYDSSGDMLYLAEGAKMRVITKPLNIAQSTLTTLFDAPATIVQFILSEDRSQLWYIYGSNLRCYDLSSGKAWCNNSTNHYPYTSTLGSLTNASRPNTITWKDAKTLLISVEDKILQYNLPN